MPPPGNTTRMRRARLVCVNRTAAPMIRRTKQNVTQIAHSKTYDMNMEYTQPQNNRIRQAPSIGSTESKSIHTIKTYTNSKQPAAVCSPTSTTVTQLTIKTQWFMHRFVGQQLRPVPNQTNSHPPHPKSIHTQTHTQIERGEWYNNASSECPNQSASAINAKFTKY